MTEKKGYAKINLFLDIEKKRKDGYHDLVSVMQTVDLSDTVCVRKNGESDIRITCENSSVPQGEDNIVYRAAKQFFAVLGREEGISVSIEKRIPVAAGLAGGSADAAAALLALNEEFENSVSIETLFSIGKSIGADVPFCMTGGTKLTLGIGDVMKALPALPYTSLVIAKSGEGISTPFAYGKLDIEHNDFFAYKIHSEQYEAIVKGLSEKNLCHIYDGLYNIFEEVTPSERPDVNWVKQTMISRGAKAVLMSGSGPSVFGFFENDEIAKKASDSLKESGAESIVSHPIQNIK